MARGCTPQDWTLQRGILTWDVQAVVQMIRSLGKRRMFLVQRPGPSCFVVQEEGKETKLKVLIGSRVTCSCR